MTPYQYNWLRRNASRRLPGELGAAPAVERLLRVAARRARCCQAAAEAWEKVADPQWLRYTEVVGVQQGVLLVSVANATYLYELSRRSAALGRQVAALAPGVQQVRFIPAGDRTR